MSLIAIISLSNFRIHHDEIILVVNKVGVADGETNSNVDTGKKGTTNDEKVTKKEMIRILADLKV